MFTFLRSKPKTDKNYLFDFKVVLLAGLIKMGYTLVTSYLILPNQSASAAELSPFGSDPLVIFLFIVLAMPVIETLFLQFGVFEVALQLSKSRKSKIIAFLLSSFLFGLLHFNGFTFFVIQVLSGAIYAYLYLFVKANCKMHAFFVTFLVHALHNFVGFMVNEVLHL
uniref:CPBP family glutamic-type intramembrane protease n=1 Tax=Roseivirga sp. TaxID=1964215 RepID=UPI00404784D5